MPQHLQRFKPRCSLDGKRERSKCTTARDLAYNPEHHSKTKHIDRRHFFVRELVEQQRIVVPYVATDDNLADFFTKPLMAKKFFAMRDKIMNNPFPSPSLDPGISSRGGVVGSEPVPTRVKES